MHTKESPLMVSSSPTRHDIPDGLGLVTNIYVVSYPKDQGRVMYDQLRIPLPP